MPLPWHEPLRRWQRRWSELSYGQQRTFQTLALLVALALVAPPLYLAVRPLLNRWRHHHALAQAAQFEQQQDYRNLVLALHRAVQIAPDDVATWRWVARTLDALGASDALVAHENIVALAPGDAQARAALAAAALRVGEPDTARAALRELERDPAQRESYLRLAAELARAEGDLPRYTAHLAELTRLRPDDVEIRFNFAIVELALPATSRQAAGRATLRSLLADPRVRVRAALELLRDAARRRDATLAAENVRAIVQSSSTGHPSIAADPWPALLASLQTAAIAGGEADIARVAQWLGTVRRSREALAWLDHLPDAIAGAPVVRDAAAELAARTDNLPRLDTLLVTRAWGDVAPESIRAALAARADRLAERGGAALTRWQEALHYAEQSPATLRAIARLARLWQDDGSLEATTKAALRLRPNSPWANRELSDLYFTRGETAKLLVHCSAWVEFEPSRPAVVFLWIRAAAALDHVTDDMLHRTETLSPDREPAPPLRLARALALAQRKRLIEATAELGKLPPESANLPDSVLVRALVTREAAPIATALGRPEQELLPEERNSLKSAAARADLNR